MIDSIFIGSTGVRSHQTRMNVISNNVANINTTAFKSGRASFAEVLSKTLHEGNPARGENSATNPRQSGLGVEVSSIDTVQQQGTLQATGIETDLAVDGEGFFILGSDANRFYSRDGTFDFDANGRLYDPATGLVVQGNLANENGSFRSELEGIIVPLDRESEAKGTSQIRLSGNLDASGVGQGGAVWGVDTQFGLPARVVSNPNPGFPLNLSDLNSAGLKVTIQQSGTVAESTLNIPTKVYQQRTDLIDELNSLVNANGTLKNRMLFRTNELGELILRTVEGGEGVVLAVDNANPDINVASRLGFVAGTQQEGQRAAKNDPLSSLANVGRDLTSGDILRFSGVKPNGERFDSQFVFEPDTSDTVADLFKVIENVYGGVQAGLDPETGRLILTDLTTNDRVVGAEINISLLDTGNGSGIFGNEPPFEYSTNTQIFDEKGASHSLTLTFTKSVVDNEWNWTATVDGLTPEAGNNGKAIFNEDGTLRTFEAADKSNLLFTPADGTPQLSVELDASNTERLGGLTQFVAPASASVREQDGRSSGRLVSINIEPGGHIVGQFSNGSAENLARISLASFGNVGGMKQDGSNLYIETQASGRPVIGAAESTIQGSIRSGTLEMSNVDLAQEFTNLILTQRGFQASARSITTSDELLTEVVNLKR